MALDVKYLRGTKAQYDGYLANTNNPDYSGNQKIVDTTYYLIYEKSIGISTPGYPLLYIGKVLLSEAAEIEAVLQKINEIEEDILNMSNDIVTLRIDVDLLKESGGNTSTSISIDKSLLPTDIEDGEVVVLTDVNAEGHTVTPVYTKVASMDYIKDALSSISITVPNIDIVKDTSVSDTMITITEEIGENTVEKEVLGLVSILRNFAVDENNGHTLIETRTAVPTVAYVEKMIANVTGGESAGEVLAQLEAFKAEVSTTYAKKSEFNFVATSTNETTQLAITVDSEKEISVPVSSVNEDGEATSIKVAATENGGLNITLEWRDM